MATITLTYEFADGDRVTAKVKTPTPYPDALSEGVKTCVDAFRAALASGLEATTNDDD